MKKSQLRRIIKEEISKTLREKEGIVNEVEQSEKLKAFIDAMARDLAAELEGGEDPINVVIPEIIKRLTAVVNDPKTSLSSTEIAQIKDEIKKYQEALDTLKNLGNS